MSEKETQDQMAETAPSVPTELAGLTIEEWADKYARLLAEFDNYRKRTREDSERRAESKKNSFIVDLLGVVDNFERALETAKDSDSSLAEGMRAIDRQLRDLLAAQDVKPIEAQGEAFDPHLHEAIGVTENADFPSNSVTSVMQAGWKRGEEVLRHARVFVNKE